MMHALVAGAVRREGTASLIKVLASLRLHWGIDYSTSAAPAHKSTFAIVTSSPSPVRSTAAAHDNFAEGLVLKSNADDLSAQQSVHPLVQYRAEYPETVWARIQQAVARQTHTVPDAVDIGIGTGRGAVELARRGFRVVGVEATPKLMSQTYHTAIAEGLALNLVPARMEGKLLTDNCADLVSVLHGLHLVDLLPALREAHRLLRPNGLLCAAWNDRNHASPFISELEDLMEGFNSQYSRHSKQRDVGYWGHQLTQEGLFHLVEYSVHANPLPLRGAAPLLDILDCLTFMRHSRAASGARRELHRQVIDLVHRHYGLAAFELPLETKLYLLRRRDSSMTSGKPAGFVPI